MHLEAVIRSIPDPAKQSLCSIYRFGAVFINGGASIQMHLKRFYSLDELIKIATICIFVSYDLQFLRIPLQNYL